MHFERYLSTNSPFLFSLNCTLYNSSDPAENRREEIDGKKALVTKFAYFFLNISMSVLFMGDLAYSSQDSNTCEQNRLQ